MLIDILSMLWVTFDFVLDYYSQTVCPSLTVFLYWPRPQHPRLEVIPYVFITIRISHMPCTQSIKTGLSLANWLSGNRKLCPDPMALPFLLRHPVHLYAMCLCSCDRTRARVCAQCFMYNIWFTHCICIYLRSLLFFFYFLLLFLFLFHMHADECTCVFVHKICCEPNCEQWGKYKTRKKTTHSESLRACTVYKCYSFYSISLNTYNEFDAQTETKASNIDNFNVPKERDVRSQEQESKKDRDGKVWREKIRFP